MQISYLQIQIITPVVVNHQILTEQKILIVAITGEARAESVADVALEFREKAAILGYRLTLDFSKAKNRISVTEGLQLAKNYNSSAFIDLSGVPISIVAVGKDYIFFKLIEQFVSNEGVKVKTFRDLKSAIAWHEAPNTR